MRNRPWLVVCALMLGAAIAFPLGVLAAHQFSDVPNTNPYHADIDALADSGVTTGCGGGKYCPSDYVTREQMAAFMNRLGALGAGRTPVVNADKVDGLTSGQFLRSDVAVDGETTCIGSEMRPEYSTMGWAVNGSSIYPTSGDHWFVCQLHPPDGATMTSFEARVADFSATAGVSCELFRSNWATGVFASVADAGATSGMGMPGYSALATTTFAQAAVDTDLFSYWAECGAMGFSQDTSIYGVRLLYQVTGLPIE